MRPPPPRIIAAHAIQQIAMRHTATALLGATAARTAAELAHKGQATPEHIAAAVERYAILLRAALGSLTATGNPGMSIADAIKLREIEATVATLLERVTALEEKLDEARQGHEATAATTLAPPLVPPAQRPPNAPAIVLGKHGGDRRSLEAIKQGGLSTLKGRKNTKAHWLGRLGRDRPDLAEKVLAGELSAHAAAIEAGFRKCRITVAGRSGRAP